MSMFYRKMIRLTHGQLEEETYKELFRLASEADTGTILEIGTARGAGTIALALGARKNPRVKRIITVDNFRYSHALKYWDDVEQNINELRKNLARYHSESTVEIMVAGEENCDLIEEYPISLLLIDADGDIKRDLERYYELLAPKAVVVIDDCRLMLTRHAMNELSRERLGYSGDVVSDAKWHANGPAPLGKDHLTYRSVDCLVENGFFSRIKTLGKTVVLQKPASAQRLDKTVLAKLSEICREEKNRYLELRKETAAIACGLDSYLRKIQRETGVMALIVSARLNYVRASFYYPIWSTMDKNEKNPAIYRVSDYKFKERVRLFFKKRIGRQGEKFRIQTINEPFWRFHSSPRFLLMTGYEDGQNSIKIPRYLLKELSHELYREENQLRACFARFL